MELKPITINGRQYFYEVKNPTTHPNTTYLGTFFYLKENEPTVTMEMVRKWFLFIPYNKLETTTNTGMKSAFSVRYYIDAYIDVEDIKKTELRYYTNKYTLEQLKKGEISI